MVNTGMTARNLKAEAYIEMADSLIAEIECAMAAITRNEVGDLEESVTEQQALAARMKVIREHCRTGDVNDPDLSLAMSVMDAKLQAVNRVYSALVQHSSHSASLMEALLDSFRGQFQEASGPRSKYQTWSCQM